MACFLLMFLKRLGFTKMIFRKGLANFVIQKKIDCILIELFIMYLCLIFVNSSHVGLGRTLTESGKLILTLFMKKVNEKTKVIPKEIIEQLEENSSEGYREMSQSGGIILCLFFIFKLIIYSCCLHKKINRNSNLSVESNADNKKEGTPFLDRDIDPELGLGILT